VGENGKNECQGERREGDINSRRSSRPACVNASKFRSCPLGLRSCPLGLREVLLSNLPCRRLRYRPALTWPQNWAWKVHLQCSAQMQLSADRSKNLSGLQSIVAVVLVHRFLCPYSVLYGVDACMHLANVAESLEPEWTCAIEIHMSDCEQLFRAIIIRIPLKFSFASNGRQRGINVFLIFPGDIIAILVKPIICEIGSCTIRSCPSASL
jgi:hypothetical protein